MELSIRKLHLVNDLMFTGLRRVVDSFDPYDWASVCTIRTIDLSIRKLHSLTAMGMIEFLQYLNKAVCWTDGLSKKMAAIPLACEQALAGY